MHCLVWVYLFILNKYNALLPIGEIVPLKTMSTQLHKTAIVHIKPISHSHGSLSVWPIYRRVSGGGTFNEVFVIIQEYFNIPLQ